MSRVQGASDVPLIFTTISGFSDRVASPWLIPSSHLCDHTTCPLYARHIGAVHNPSCAQHNST